MDTSDGDSWAIKDGGEHTTVINGKVFWNEELEAARKVDEAQA